MLPIHTHNGMGAGVALTSDTAHAAVVGHRAEVQTRAAAVLQSRRDAVIQSETGSGKTMSFLMPVLSQLDYPPQVPLSEFQACRTPHVKCSRASKMTDIKPLYPAAVAGQPVCLPRGRCTDLKHCAVFRVIVPESASHAITCRGHSVWCWCPPASWGCKSRCWCTACLAGTPQQ